MKRRNKKRAAIIIIIIIAFIISLMILIKKNKVIKKIEKFDMIIYPNARNIKPILYKTLLFCNNEVQYNISMKFPPKKIIEYYDKELEKRGYKIYVEEAYRTGIRKWFFFDSFVNDKGELQKGKVTVFFSYWTDPKKKIRAFLRLMYKGEFVGLSEKKPVSDLLNIYFSVYPFKKFSSPTKTKLKEKSKYHIPEGYYRIIDGNLEIRNVHELFERVENPEKWIKMEDLNGVENFVSKEKIIEKNDIDYIKVEKSYFLNDNCYDIRLILTKTSKKKILTKIRNSKFKKMAFIRFDRIYFYIRNMSKKKSKDNFLIVCVSEKELSVILLGTKRILNDEHKLFILSTK